MYLLQFLCLVFNCSFIVQAKLRSHIRDPNAPELVHFLFTPLALIVDTSGDSFFEASLPPKVGTAVLSKHYFVGHADSSIFH